MGKFKLSNSNKDGSLSHDELPALFYPEVDPALLELVTNSQLTRRDRNGDRKLSLDEADDEKADFDALDKDKDGFLSLKELEHWESGRFHSEAAMKDLMQMADEDNDEHITASELAQVQETIQGSDGEMAL